MGVKVADRAHARRNLRKLTLTEAGQESGLEAKERGIHSAGPAALHGCRKNPTLRPALKAGPRRRFGRRFAEWRNGTENSGGDLEQNGRFDLSGIRQTKQVEFLDGFLRLLLPLRFLSFLDNLAKFTGVEAAKSFCERLGEGGIVRIAERHPNPCHRLEQRPVSADGENQRADNQPMTEPSQHSKKFRENLTEVNPLDGKSLGAKSQGYGCCQFIHRS